MEAALKVIALTPATRAWLAANDPQALRQVDEAAGIDETPRPFPGAPGSSSQHQLAVSLVIQQINRMQLRGRYVKLRSELPHLSAEALEQLRYLLRNAEHAIDDAAHTYRPFPGGPRIRG